MRLINFFVLCLISSQALAMEYKRTDLEEKKQELSELTKQLEKVKLQLLELTELKEDLEKKVTDLSLEIKVETFGVTDEGVKFINWISKVCKRRLSGRHLEFIDKNMPLLNAKNLNGETPLSVAVSCSKWNLVKELIESGAIITDAIFIATVRKYDDAINKNLVKKIIEYMLLNKANPNAQYRNTSLWNVFLKKHDRTNSDAICDLAELLVKHGSDIILRSVAIDHQGKTILVTPLEFAVINHFPSKVIDCLKRLGATE